MAKKPTAKTYTSSKTGQKYWLDDFEKRLTLNDKVVKKGKTKLSKSTRKVVEGTVKGVSQAKKQTKKLEQSGALKGLKKVPVKPRGAGLRGGGVTFGGGGGLRTYNR